MRLQIDQGGLDGFVHDGIVTFRAIPFATAERFRHPGPAPLWSGVRDATVAGAQSPQIPGPLEAMLGASEIPMDEDCLTLTVTTPGCDDARRPVLVWVHGGAFLTGTGAMPWYDGASLARRGDVVVVSINYRLGVLGFLGSTNIGVADQIAALEWVHRSIAAFGGDPDTVTVFGESAGGSSVVSLLAAPRTAGLVHRAWAMSPSIGQLRRLERAHAVEQQVLASTGCASTDELLSLDLAALLKAQAEVVASPAAGFDGFSPTAGGDLLPDSICAAAAANPVPLVLGTTRDEMNLFVLFDPVLSQLDAAGVREQIEQRLGDRTDEALRVYAEHRPGSTPVQLLSAVQTDETFRVPAQRLAEARVAAGNPTWTTWFTWQSQAFGGGLGACHGLDIPFVFDNLRQPGVTRFTGDGTDRQAVASAHADALVAFARTGVAPWNSVSGTERPTLRIDVVTEEIDDPEPDIRDLWGPGEAGA